MDELMLTMVSWLGISLDKVLLLLVVAFIAGFVDSIAGGGGLIMLPSLLSTGVPVQLALGTNKMISISGTLIATITYLHKKIIQPREWLVCALATLLGSVLGVITIQLLDPSIIKKMIPLVIMVIAVYLLIPQRRRHDMTQTVVPNHLQQTSVGLGLGFYDGFIGPGTGTFWTIIVHKYFRQHLVYAAGIARLMNLMSNAAALTIFLSFGMVHLLLGVLMGSANMLGSFIGTRSAIKYGEKFIRPLFIMFVILIAARLAYLEYIA